MPHMHPCCTFISNESYDVMGVYAHSSGSKMVDLVFDRS
jgi:hypothetical protein